MHHALRFLCLFLAAGLGMLSFAAPVWSLEDRDEILVGRIAYIEGDLLRYVPEEKDWTLTVVDAPFGLEDTLYSGENGRAELILPNGAWMRIGENSQVQMIDLVADAATIDVASGQARFYNKSSDTIIKATTPMGSVVAPAGSAFDLYVGDESLEVIAVRGEVEFVHESTGQRYPVREGGDSVIADNQTVTGGNGTVDGDWDDWNNQRESLWAQRQQVRSRSAGLLPEPIRNETYALEENGRWEQVYYDGGYQNMWRPTRVAAGWQPFTVGRWVDYYGDRCWIPGEPFGYMTHHYGSWVYVDSFRSWYWMPPVVRRHASRPTVVIGLGWYPGRVGWFNRGNEIGWVPLAPNEDYYGYRHWGHRTKVIRHSVPMINLARYRYISHSCVIDRDHFYRRHRYPDDIRRDLRRNESFNQFKPLTTWDAFKGDKRRFDFGDREARLKPHTMTFERIRQNQERSRDGRGFDRQRIEQDLRRVKTGRKLEQRQDRHSPFVSHKMVDAGQRSQPMDRSALPRKELKPQERERRPVRDNRGGDERNPGRGREGAGSMDDRGDRLQNRPVRGEEPGQRPLSPRDRQGRRLTPEEEAGAGRQEMRRGPRDPREIRDRRNQEGSETERNVSNDRQKVTTPPTEEGGRANRSNRSFQDPRRERPDKLGEGSNPQNPQEQQPQQLERRNQQRRDQSRQRQEEDPRSKELERRQPEQRRQPPQQDEQVQQQMKRQRLQENEQRQQRMDQDRLERQQQQQDEQRNRQQELRRQQDAQQQQELRRRQQEEQQRNEANERRQQQQELKRRQQEQEMQQQQQLQQRQQRESRQRQEEVQTRQPREEQHRVQRQPAAENRAAGDQNQQQKRRKRPTPEEEQQNQQL